MFLTLVFLILCAFLASSSSGQAYAVLTNITIDDTNNAFWTFVGSYSAVTPSTPCSACFAQPDAGLAYNSTWHDGSGLSGSFVFQGLLNLFFSVLLVVRSLINSHRHSQALRYISMGSTS
jgi:hypothetical protein